MNNEKPINNNSHNYAMQIEHLLRGIFMCDKYTFGEEIRADVISTHPLFSMMLGLAIIYHHACGDRKKIIDNFINEYDKYENMSISDIMEREDGEDQVKIMISKFRELI